MLLKYDVSCFDLRKSGLNPIYEGFRKQPHTDACKPSYHTKEEYVVAMSFCFQCYVSISVISDHDFLVSCNF